MKRQMNSASVKPSLGVTYNSACKLTSVSRLRWGILKRKYILAVTVLILFLVLELCSH